MGKMAPGRKDYVDDVSEQDKADYAEWLEAQSEKTDGADEGEFSVARWLKGRAMDDGTRIVIDLDAVVLKTKSFCPYGFYAATLESVKTRYTDRGFEYLILRFEVEFKDQEDEEVQVFYPTMVRWVKTSDGRVPVRTQKVLDAFECPAPSDMIHYVGELVNIEVVKGDDFDWNGQKYMKARIKSVTPWTIIGPWPEKDSASLQRKITEQTPEELLADVN